MKTILTPVDFSSVTAHVADEALKLARAFDGRVFLLHVVRVPQAASDYAMGLGGVAELTSTLERQAENQLAEIGDRLRHDGATVDSLRVSGYPAMEILALAKKLPADFIVMGSHGHTALYDLVVGSTASAVIKRAPCPVVVIPAPNKARHVDWATALPAVPLEAL